MYPAVWRGTQLKSILEHCGELKTACPSVHSGWFLLQEEEVSMYSPAMGTVNEAPGRLSSIKRAAGLWCRNMRYVLFPRCCAGCGMSDSILCGSCSALLHRRLSRPLHDYFTDPDMACTVYSCSAYNRYIRQAILSWKDHGDEELDKPFSYAMEELVNGLYPKVLSLLPSGQAAVGADGSMRDECIYVMPAPSGRGSFYRRGRLQVLPLCYAAARALNAHGADACVVPFLHMHGRLQKSVSHNDRRSRMGRLSGRVSVAHPHRVAGHPVILIDDIMTTGSTLRSCERVLREAGARVYAALTLSMVPGDADGLQLPRPALAACNPQWTA